MKINLDFSSYNAVTRLRDWWNAVKGNFTDVQNTINVLDDDITAETNARKTSDNTLNGRITGEATARENADNDIANGTRAINPKLGTSTKYGDKEIADGLQFLTDAVAWFDMQGRSWFKFMSNGNLDGIEVMLRNCTLLPDQNSGFSSIAAIAAAISEINTIIGSQVALTDLDDGSGRYSADMLPRNKLIRLTNDTNTDLTFFQDHDEYGTVLSEPIPAGESRLIVKVLESYGGAETADGYIYVLNGQELKKTVGRLDNRISTVKNAVDIINGDDTVPGSVSKKIKNAVDPIANGTREIAPLLYPETKYFNGDSVSVITAGLNFIRWITHSYESLYPGGALKDIYTLNNNIRLGDKALLLDPEEYCGWKSLWDLAASVCNYADGTDTISPRLGSGTLYQDQSIRDGLSFLTNLEYDTGTKNWAWNGGYIFIPQGCFGIDIECTNDGYTYQGDSIDDGLGMLPKLTYNSDEDIYTLDGSIMADNIIGTIRNSELHLDTRLDPLEFYGYSTLVDAIRDVDSAYTILTNTYGTYSGVAAAINGLITRVATLEANMPTPATEAEIREAWNAGGRGNE